MECPIPTKTKMGLPIAQTLVHKIVARPRRAYVDAVVRMWTQMGMASWIALTNVQMIPIKSSPVPVDAV